jgi:2-dehydro-3-deoxyphosphogluconate aldolase / (4S)-4-hydroxy-2-oxoglutarate aldolase
MNLGTLEGRIQNTGVIAILRDACADFINRDFPQLVDAGLEVVEVSKSATDFRTCLDLVVKEWHGRIEIGAGTILSPEDAEEALSAGATFLISPHFDRKLVDFVSKQEVPYIVGCYTASEIVQAMVAGVSAIKMFPAFLGGPRYIRALLAPFPNARLVPTGGVSPENAEEYWKAGAWAVGIGAELRAIAGEQGWSGSQLKQFFRRGGASA